MSAAKHALREALRASPNASEKEISDSMWAVMNSNAAIRRDIFEHWFGLNFKRFAVETTEHSTAIIEKHRKMRRIGKRTTKAVKEKLKIVLMDHMLSCGTILRFATFGECVAEGGWLSEVGKFGRANQVVGKTLTETDIQNIRSRVSRKLAA